MHGCLLRVNDLPITSVRLKARGETFEILIEDPEYGAFPLSRSCTIEYLDLAVPKEIRVKDPFHGWRRVTYDESATIVRDIKTRTSS